MPQTPQVAAIYARISLDRDHTRQGVDRQLADCRALAERLGWTVAAEYIDNDISAHSGKPRPAFRRMMEDVRERRRDGIIAWHPDRITRRTRDLVTFIDTCNDAQVRVSTVQGGHYDFSTASGRMNARLVGVVAEHESEHMAERISRALQHQAEQGAPLSRGNRHYGYEPDGATIREAEAAIIRDLANRCLSGESLTGLVRWLNDSGTPTSSGRGVWRVTTLRRLLSSAYLSGQREFQGVTVTKGTWPAVLAEEQTAALRAIFASPERRTLRTPSRYLLTGIAVCARCGHRLVSAVDKTTPAYRCRRQPHNDACGRLQIAAEPLETFIRDAALTALDTPDLTAIQTDTTGSDLLASIKDAEAKLAELGRDYADGTIHRITMQAATRRLRERITANSLALAATTHRHAVHQYAGRSTELRAAWESMTNDQRRSIVGAVVEAVTIGPGLPGVRRFQHERVSIRWRV
jgi:site-specific DNA recombinase